MPSGGAVAIVEGLHMVAATNGFLVVGHGDVNVEVGLVGEVVDARIPALAQVVRLALEAHTEVVDVVGAPPFHAAPHLTERGAAIAHIEYGTLASLHRFIENDGQKVAVLTKTLNAVIVTSHVGRNETFQFQNDGIGAGGGCEIDKRLPLQGVVSEIEAPNMDFVVRHVDAFT